MLTQFLDSLRGVFARVESSSDGLVAEHLADLAAAVLVRLVSEADFTPGASLEDNLAKVEDAIRSKVGATAQDLAGATPPAAAVSGDQAAALQAENARLKEQLAAAQQAPAGSGSSQSGSSEAAPSQPGAPSPPTDPAL